LTRLYLNENAVTDEGCVALAHAVTVLSGRARAAAAAASAAAAAASAAGTAASTSSSSTGAAAAAAAVDPQGGVRTQQRRRRRRSGVCVLGRLGLSDNAIGPAGGAALLAALAMGSTLEKCCCSDNPFGRQVHAALSALPNVFAGAKPRKGRSSQVLNGAVCTTVVVWRPPPPAAAAAAAAAAMCMA